MNLFFTFNNIGSIIIKILVYSYFTTKHNEKGREVMKRKHLLAIVMICPILMSCAGNLPETQVTESFACVDYVSELSKEECFLCGENTDLTADYWGQDNIGILNLNTFEILCIPINRYDDHGQLIETAAGYMTSELAEMEKCYVSAWTVPDRGYSHVRLDGVKSVIDAESVQNHLCQDCLEPINKVHLWDGVPAEFAVVNFSERTIHTLTEYCTWFTTGNYCISCEYKDNNNIRLLIIFCPSRYECE